MRFRKSGKGGKIMNVEMQCCGLILDILLIYFYLRHETVGLYSERIFRISLVVNTVCICLDIISVFAIMVSESIPGILVDISCKIYLVSLLTSASLGFTYTYNDVPHLRDDEAFTRITKIVYFLGVFFIMVLPVNYYREGRIVYSSGLSAYATYIFAPVFIVGALLLTFIEGKFMNNHRKNAVRAWMSLEILAAVLQFIFPQLLLVGFGSAVGLFIMYSELESPEVYLDRATGVFSYDTLMTYLKQLYADGQKFTGIMVCTDDEWHMEGETEQGILLEISEFLHSFSKAKLFRCTGNDFMLIYANKLFEHNEMESMLNLDVIKTRFQEPFGNNIQINAQFLYIPDTRIATSYDEYLEICRIYKGELMVGEVSRVLDESAGTHIREQRQVKAEITKALAEDRLEVYFQPIYSIHRERFVSAEALARIVTTEGKLLMPGIFIPVAEEYGLISQIGEKVFELTCRFFREEKMTERGIDYFEVNLSVAQCENARLHEVYQRIMNKEDISPDAINLEITESSALKNRNILLDNMNALGNLGCSFALDDFGTGESNLNYILDMPVQLIKFDRSMVQDYFVNERAKVVMRSTVAMIKEIGLKIVAEGVETKEQLDAMKELGVDYIQGYYFSKPLPRKEFLKFLEKNNQTVEENAVL